MLLFRFVGALLLRCADRQFLALSFQFPPRFTRFEPPGVATLVTSIPVPSQPSTARGTRATRHAG
jgi:hypothetical protein